MRRCRSTRSPAGSDNARCWPRGWPDAPKSSYSTSPPRGSMRKVGTAPAPCLPRRRGAVPRWPASATSMRPSPPRTMLCTSTAVGCLFPAAIKRPRQPHAPAESGGIGALGSVVHAAVDHHGVGGGLAVGQHILRHHALILVPEHVAVIHVRGRGIGVSAERDGELDRGAGLDEHGVLPAPIARRRRVPVLRRNDELRAVNVEVV